MTFKFVLDELGDSEIEIQRSFWTGRTLVFVDGNEVRKQKQGGYYEIESHNHEIKKLKIKGASFDGIPKIFFEDKEIVLARKLLWYEYLLAGFPLVLALTGGAMGGLFGALATLYNFRIIRSNMSLLFKILSIVATTIIAGLFYVIFAAALIMLLR
ncbi:MAG: hypothetical protein K0Q99_1358 [Clostridia bacterium]|nr:hypothetical protein [Clostridia bacterium]